MSGLPIFVKQNLLGSFLNEPCGATRRKGYFGRLCKLTDIAIFAVVVRLIFMGSFYYDELDADLKEAIERLDPAVQERFHKLLFALGKLSKSTLERQKKR